MACVCFIVPPAAFRRQRRAGGFETLGPALADIDAVIETLAEHGGRPAGPLRITLPRLAAEDLIVPRLGEFLRLYPDISLEISTDDRFEDIVAKGFDAGLRLGSTSMPI